MIFPKSLPFSIMAANGILKSLFSSTTRIKLLKTFLLNPDQEYFIRELTRMLDEQINSVRRELNNLKRIGLLKARNRDRKKYFYLDPTFLIYSELTSIFQKDDASGGEVVKKVSKMGKIDLLVLSGIFIGDESAPIDLFVVGDVDKEKLSHYTSQDLKHDKPVRFTVLSKSDFLYRLECNDKFVTHLLQDEGNVIAINKLSKDIQKTQK